MCLKIKIKKNKYNYNQNYYLILKILLQKVFGKSNLQ